MAGATAVDDLLGPPPRLSGEALLAAQREALDAIARDEGERAKLFAQTCAHRAQVADLWAGSQPGSGLMELAGTARIGQQRAARQVEDAVRLVQLFPRALALLSKGRMFQGTAEMLLTITRYLSAELQLLVDERVSVEIGGLDAKDAREVIVTAVAELPDPEEAREQHERARAQRGVWVKPVEDGMARIGAETDQVAARRWALDFEELVRAQALEDARSGRKRTTQQRRADVFAELPSRHLALLQALQRGEAEQLLATVLTPSSESAESSGPPRLIEVVAAWCRLPVRNPITLHVHTPMTTVLDLDNRSGAVEGLGVIAAHQVRLLRPVASLARLWVDERTGQPLGLDDDVHPPPAGVDIAQLVRQRLLGMLRPTVLTDEAEPRHDPSPRLRRLVEVRDVGCDGPGCSMPARACELDHDVPYAQQGATGVWNLKARSPRCHHGKHDGWSVARSPDGSSLWTSPTGRRYRRRARWRRPVLPTADPWAELTLPDPRPDQLDDTDPREDWHRPLWLGDEPPTF